MSILPVEAVSPRGFIVIVDLGQELDESFTDRKVNHLNTIVVAAVIL